MNDYELYHHGILGMHWGIRRYQNPDGTYTVLGKLRRKQNADSEESAPEEIQTEKKYSTAQKLRRKLTGEDQDPDYRSAHAKTNLKYMTSEELKKRNERLNLENNYMRNLKQNKELRETPIKKSAEKQSSQFVKKVLLDPATDYAAKRMKEKLPEIFEYGESYVKKQMNGKK